MLLRPKAMILLGVEIVAEDCQARRGCTNENMNANARLIGDKIREGTEKRRVDCRTGVVRESLETRSCGPEGGKEVVAGVSVSSEHKIGSLCRRNYQYANN